ncbi:MAG: ABC transporter ATP-binding protein [Fimbriimonadaceae bacterium]|nr:ABC transporter ATP-binding protein [Chitinophagales bacterium]
MRHLKALNKYFIKYKWLLLLGVLFVTLTNVFSVIQPRYIREAIDFAFQKKQEYDAQLNVEAKDTIVNTLTRGLLFIVLYYVGFTVLRGLFMFLMRQTIIVMSRHVEYDQKNELYAHYQKLTPAFYKKNNTGDLMSRVAEDVGRVRQYVGPAVMYFLNLVVTFILVIGVMIHISPTLTLYVLLPLPILSISIYYVNNIIQKKSELIQAQLSNLTSIAQETFSGIRVIKAYAQEKNTENYFEENCEEYKNRSLSLSKVDAMFQPLMILLIGLSTLITILVGGIEVMHGNITPGNVAEFMIYVNMLTWPVTSLGWVASIIQRAAASQKRINEFLDTKPDIETPFKTNYSINGNITFKNVSFTYPDTGVEALKNISFEIRSGEKIAIIGRTGSGKTTIADLLVRMYDPTEGEIYIDDIELKKYNLENMRSQVSYVPQDVFLFGDSIKNNIAFSNTSTSLETVKQYAQFASIDEEIEQFKDQYETIVGERGVTLSGGQKQRISIARAFLKNAPIIILDDCLSAVDANTEKSILANMRNYLQNKTAIIITHRIFSLLEFDKIIVLDGHSVAEIGTHRELMEHRGVYYDIFETQQAEESA